MGVNKNISIFMLFDCVRVNRGLGFQFFVIEGYIAMINSTDKISTRVSCSMWSFLLCLVDVTELRHKLVCLFDVSR
jgi:hypothetical protein